MKTKLTVKTDAGTFTRTTARTYTYVVVGNQTRFELLEAMRLDALKEARKNLPTYQDPVAYRERHLRAAPAASRAFDLECHNRYLADGSYAKWAASTAAEIAKLEASGPITADVVGSFGVIGWCGRLDLARKLATGDYVAQRCREVRIYDVTTGARVS